ncbi:pentapeptide repeat-containing protein [Micromonospora sp. NPDC000207]|uniref:pentapeptide repeat-containing protein n=1 Tax=Micromonospora sp. NPDC000207 TaxID=3154246 RepID=UPI0033249CA5
MLALAVVALAVTAVAAWVMWEATQIPSDVPNSPDLAVRSAQLRVDVVRNILGVGAGAGGLVALFLALRKQYVKERVDHADQENKARIAEDTSYDATEKRVTELYAKAGEHLGSEKAAVRMAALYTLERLAQGNPSHRQTVANLICAYLRMPFADAANIFALARGERVSTDLSKDTLLLQELEVRRAAQILLREHLIRVSLNENKEPASSIFWGPLDLDLRGADLFDFSMHGCSVRTLNLLRARLHGFTDFESGDFEIFDATDASFEGNFAFSNTTVSDYTSFICAQFNGSSSFHNSHFKSVAEFDDASFFDTVSFSECSTGTLLARGVEAIGVPRGGKHVWPKGYELVRSDGSEMWRLNESANVPLNMPSRLSKSDVQSSDCPQPARGQSPRRSQRPSN